MGRGLQPPGRSRLERGPRCAGHPGGSCWEVTRWTRVLQLGCSSSLPPPESSPLTHSRTQQIFICTCSCLGSPLRRPGGHMGPGSGHQPRSGRRGSGGNRCAPSAPRAAPPSPEPQPCPAGCHFWESRPPSADGLSALSRAQWGRGPSLTPGRDPRPWPPGLGTLSCVGDQGLHPPVGCHKERFGGFRGGAWQPIAPPSGSPGSPSCASSPLPPFPGPCQPSSPPHPQAAGFLASAPLPQWPKQDGSSHRRAVW